MDSKIKTIFANLFGVEESSLSDASSPQTIDQWDSLKHLSLIASIEEQFGIKVTEDEMMGMDSIAAIKKILAVKGARA